MQTSTRQRMLLATILSISLLTIMAGAAVAPALEVIRAYFHDESQLLVQMIISMPALLIVLTSFFFGRLCRRFSAKTLVLAGLTLYILGGCAAGAFDHIGLVLAARALLGIGVGILMPLSTGLLAYYFPPEAQERLMGYSSAMNQMGGAVATLFSGLLAGISWRASFLVYALGLVSIVPCIFFLPNDRIQSTAAPRRSGSLRTYGKEMVAMFLLMLTFFLYPSNFAMETVAEGVISQRYISVIMAFMDILAFFGGLCFVHVKKKLGRNTCYFAPALFLAGYVLLALVGGWTGTLAGSVLIGFANGAGIPYLIAAVSQRAAGQHGGE